jgi:hypothetical protein
VHSFAWILSAKTALRPGVGSMPKPALGAKIIVRTGDLGTNMIRLEF